MCGGHTKGCSATADGLRRCRDTPADPAGWRKVSDGPSGFAGYRPAGEPVWPAVRVASARPVTDWAAEARRWARGFTAGAAAALGRHLGLPPGVFAALPLVGCQRATDQGCTYLFPEEDGAGGVIGLATREVAGGRAGGPTAPGRCSWRRGRRTPWP